MVYTRKAGTAASASQVGGSGSKRARSLSNGNLPDGSTVNKRKRGGKKTAPPLDPTTLIDPPTTIDPPTLPTDDEEEAGENDDVFDE
jgi:hypothetical protein